MKRVKRIGRFLMRLLRELADEGAYQRHLAVHGTASSAHEWRRFSEQRMRAKYTQPKCC